MRISDKSKIQKIVKSLKKHPEGTYLSEIAREAKLAKSTVNFLLAKHFSKKIEIVKRGKKFKIIKLKKNIKTILLPIH